MMLGRKKTMNIDYSKMIDKAEDKGPSIKFSNGCWFWADEVWNWHGPCSSEESTIRRQHLYVLCECEGAYIIRTKEEWCEKINSEPEDSIHPCDHWAPWDCMCAGSCSCHFKEK